MINDIKAPLQQLLQMATKAERSIKAAKEQLKRQKLKAAVAEVKKAAKEDVKETVAIFDQGVAAASQISRITFAEAVGKLKDFDLSAPVVIEAKDILSDALKSVQSQLDGFKAGFDIGRKGKPGIRASKPIEDDDATAAWNFAAKVMELFKESGGLLGVDKLGPSLKKQAVCSIFGIDETYDRVCSEPCGLAAVRLTVEGSRTLVSTDSLQLQGFMSRKGVPGPIPLTRQGAFFRSMSPQVIQEYLQECSMWTTTLTAGDLLFVPFGMLVGERVTSPTFGLRYPLMLNALKQANMAQALDKKKQEYESTLAAAKTEEAKSRMKTELEILQEMMAAFI